MYEGISIDTLTEDEEFVRFEHRKNYIVPAGKKHQIVHDKDNNDIGIAFSRNGRTDFRCFDKQIIYWFGNPYAYVVDNSLGEIVRLSGLV